MPKTKPILFSTEMVRGILDGRKTCTRRIIDIQPPAACDIQKVPEGYRHAGDWCLHCEDPILDPANHTPYGLSYTPPYNIGDILYVRESFAVHDPFENEIVYRADYDPGRAKDWKWKPSIHMPAEYARIFLRVTDVHPERLQDITEDGAEEEGMSPGRQISRTSLPAATARDAFKELWNSLYKSSDWEKSWAGNPWVWVITFEKCEKPEDE